MSTIRRGLFGAVLAAGWLVLAGTAFAVAPEVRDEAKFFSADAVRKANQTIKDINKKHGKDLLIETFAAIPAERKKDYKPEERDKFFEKWARERAAAAGVNGIYILICKEPPRLQVEVGTKTRQKAFTLKDRDKLRDLLLKHFRDKKFDEGLAEAVQMVETTLKSNLGK